VCERERERKRERERERVSDHDAQSIHGRVFISEVKQVFSGAKNRLNDGLT